MNNTQERSIGRLEGKIDLVIQEVKELNRAFRALEDGRVSTLERNFANLSGKLAIISAIVSFIVSIGIVLLQRFL